MGMRREGDNACQLAAIAKVASSYNLAWASRFFLCGWMSGVIVGVAVVTDELCATLSLINKHTANEYHDHDRVSNPPVPLRDR